MDISAVTADFQSKLQSSLDKAVAKIEQKMGTMQGEIKALTKRCDGPGAAVPAVPGVPAPAAAPAQQPPWWYQQPPTWAQQTPQVAAQPPVPHQPYAQTSAPQPPYAPPQDGYRPRRRCFECNSFDHIVRDCPQKAQAMQAAVMAAMDARDARSAQQGPQPN